MYGKNDGRVFVFGAGVSKAVAGAPVMKELFLKMKERYEYEKTRPDCPEGNNRILWFERIRKFVKKIESKAKGLFNQIEKNGNVQIKSNIRENIEYLITLLDIHTEYGAMLKFEQPGVDWDSYPFIPLDCTDRDEIREIRSYLTTYLYLCLSNLEDKNGILQKFFGKQLRPDDRLITFNYDLLIEKTLWKIGQWSPVEGYAGVGQFEHEKDEKDLMKAGYRCSTHRILKLHGSINWEWEYGLGQPEINNPIIVLDDREKWGFSFSRLEKILKREPKQPSGREERSISEGYAGSYSPLPWILPSYVKVFSKAPFLVKIWREAQRIFFQAKRLVLLGYSFPEVDSASQVLLASLPDDCSILIVDPDADKIKARIDKLFHFPDVSVKSMRLEEWVKKDCPEI